MRFIFGLLTGLFKVKFIIWAVALWFVWSTMGTGWTLLIAYGLAAFALFKWGPAEKGGGLSGFTLGPTKGSPYALIAPLAVTALFPLCVINACMNGVGRGGQIS